MGKPLNSSRNPGAFSHAEQFELVAFAHAIEAAVISQDLDARLGNPRARTQVLHGSEDAIPPGFHDALCRLSDGIIVYPRLYSGHCRLIFLFPVDEGGTLCITDLLLPVVFLKNKRGMPNGTQGKSE